MVRIAKRMSRTPRTILGHTIAIMKSEKPNSIPVIVLFSKNLNILNHKRHKLAKKEDRAKQKENEGNGTNDTVRSVEKAAGSIQRKNGKTKHLINRF